MSGQELAGYASALLVGLVIGLAGGGGSILTVPIFVYVFGIPTVLATTYSLFVVGATSLVGSIHHIWQKRVDMRVTAAFALPSFVSIYLSRRFLVPALPDPLLQINDFVLPKSKAILYFFAVVMLLAARAMIRSTRPEQGEAADGKPRYLSLSLDGLAVGLLTGTIGAGGGFLIVPMLVLLAGLPIHRAVATSILIIAINSFVGFAGDIHHTDLDWNFLLPFTGLSIIGIFAGMYFSRFVAPDRLKKGFGWFVLIVACYMILKELSTV
ncbi:MULTISPECIES: sulfite exporter TauE/SafE family protein [Spirosoma]|uniref:Probable membrane transporter protein n=1 Tax=Spirosoma liriopis TaxID=2937440 RepID=A0ABT0HIC6_9BACT|nr:MULTISPECIES: sulfite exporter TauE/SafE family protein [Spirosoma]MCK8491901.1 sulfite exporter TauE/SafE family protein [Spirosoma liriopis]UHG91222.1 sulfite exporter TauE/SafE family protein [Spirosoma oryzicola]